MRTANTRIIFDDDEILGSSKYFAITNFILNAYTDQESLFHCIEKKETAKFKIKSSAMNKLAQKSRIKPSSSQAGL